MENKTQEATRIIHKVYKEYKREIKQEIAAGLELYLINTFWEELKLKVGIAILQEFYQFPPNWEKLWKKTAEPFGEEIRVLFMDEHNYSFCLINGGYYGYVNPALRSEQLN